MEKEESLELEKELKVYEVGYLLLPYVQEADLAREVDLIKTAIADAGGVVFSDENPRLMNLAYPMSKVFNNKKTKFENAYFGWIKFDGDPKFAGKLKKAMDLNPNVLRFIILKTVRENTIARKPAAAFTRISKPVTKEEVKAAEGTPKEVINEETLDKTIEELVID